MDIMIATQRAIVESRIVTTREDLVCWLRRAQLGSQPSISEIRAAIDALTAAAVTTERLEMLEGQLRMLDIVGR